MPAEEWNDPTLARRFLILWHTYHETCVASDQMKAINAIWCMPIVMLIIYDNTVGRTFVESLTFLIMHQHPQSRQQTFVGTDTVNHNVIISLASPHRM